MEPLTQTEIKSIVNSVNKVLKTRNIEHLTKAAYKFVMLSPGFIAHYDIHGFKAAYSNVNNLQADLERNYHAAMWLNFRPGEQNYEYYMSKAEVYKQFNINAPQSRNSFW